VDLHSSSSSNQSFAIFSANPSWLSPTARLMARKKAAVKAHKPRYEGHYQLLYDVWRDPGALQRHLEAGHDINMPDSRGETLLFIACAHAEALSKGSDTLVKQLLQAGAEPNSGNRRGFTALMLTSSPDIANYLLNSGADIKAEANLGSTALEQACCGGRTAVVKVLLKRGALGQVLKANKQGNLPLSAAAKSGHEDVTLLLLQHLAMQPGFDINHPRLATNQPLLCCAAEVGLCRVAEFALDHGADVELAGPDAQPLIMAVQRGHVSMVSLLCERGASVQTRFGHMNSLDEAVISGDKGADMVKVLLKHGADVNVVADSGKHSVAVLEAAAVGDCNIVQLLLEAGAVLDADMQLKVVNDICSMLEDAVAVKVVKLAASSSATACCWC
jgi:ankyrin repeat protein